MHIYIADQERCRTVSCVQHRQSNLNGLDPGRPSRRNSNYQKCIAYGIARAAGSLSAIKGGFAQFATRKRVASSGFDNVTYYRIEILRDFRLRRVSSE